MHDVLIVGGGVAGSCTAIHLARSGVRVVLFDRSRFPRPKVCGEGIFPMGAAELRSLGVLSAVEKRGATLARLRFNQGARSAETKLSPAGRTGLGICRSQLDTLLLEAAASAGVEVRQGTVARELVTAASGSYEGVLTAAGRVTARMIVAADGLRSGLRRRAGLTGRTVGRRYGASAHFATAGPAGDRIDVRFHGDHEVYVTPVGESLVNVALLCGPAVARSLSGNLKAGYLERVQASLSRYGPELTNDVQATGPFPAEARRLSRRNLLLVGDAAGFFDGISGEGISIALRSAPLAAAAVRSYLETGSELSFEQYASQARRLRRPSTLFARLMLFLSARPRLAGAALRNLQRRPEVFVRLTGVSGGELELKDLRPTDVSGLLLGI